MATSRAPMATSRAPMTVQPNSRDMLPYIPGATDEDTQIAAFGGGGGGGSGIQQTAVPWVQDPEMTPFQLGTMGMRNSPIPGGPRAFGPAFESRASPLSTALQLGGGGWAPL